MKKSKVVKLVLISSLLASCAKEKKEEKWDDQQVYMRSDETANYNHSSNNALLWYMAFRPYGHYSGGNYHHAGMYSNSISHSSNVGRSSFKSSVTTSSRGGFGSSSHYSASS